MPEGYKFPDEIDQDIKAADAEPKIEIEIEDDTPIEDRNRRPADAAAVKLLEVEVDDLDKYSKDAKDKLIKMKRVWNDERRRAEAAERERHAAIDAAQRLLDENNRMKQMLNEGASDYKKAKKDSAKARLKAAEKAYKSAYDAGDSQKVLSAQQNMLKAQLELDDAKKFKLPSLQQEYFAVQPQQQVQAPPPRDEKLESWQMDNPWFGQDEEMTAAAYGVHERLKKQGVELGSDEYYAELDKTMRKRFAENFDEDDAGHQAVEARRKADSPKTKPSTVVASASRSTAPKRVRLTTSQVAIVKKLGITPEQYVKEFLKVEA